MIEAVPGVRKIAVLADFNVTAPAHLQELKDAARGRGIEALVRGVAKRADVISAIDDVKASGAQAVNFLATPVFSINAADFIRHVTTLSLPSIYQWPEDAEDGALIGYGPRFMETYRERARIVVKVLRGAKRRMFPSSSRPGSNLSSTCRPPRQSVMKYSWLVGADKVIE